MKYSTRFISATKEYCEFLHFVPAPYLRKTFEVDFVPEKAEMLVTGLVDDVREVAAGYECGIGIENFNDIHEGDVIEAYTMEEVKR